MLDIYCELLSFQVWLEVQFKEVVGVALQIVLHVWCDQSAKEETRIIFYFRAHNATMEIYWWRPSEQ